MSKIQWGSIIVAAIIGGIVSQVAIPYIQENYYSNQPNVYVELYGLNNTLNLDENSHVILNITQNGKPTRDMRIIPIKVKNYTYPENFKPYALTISNQGDAIAQNIIVKIQLGIRTSVHNLTVDNSENVKVNRGQDGGSIIEFEINRLLPGDRHEINFVLEGNSIESIFASDNTQKNIKTIHVFELRLDPQK
jgi:hypothetical protein